MSKKHKATLETYRAHYAAIFTGLENLDNDELRNLQAACEWPTNVNCGWDVYRVAQILKPEIAGIQARRSKNVIEESLSPRQLMALTDEHN